MHARPGARSILAALALLAACAADEASPSHGDEAGSGGKGGKGGSAGKGGSGAGGSAGSFPGAGAGGAGGAGASGSSGQAGGQGGAGAQGGSAQAGSAQAGSSQAGSSQAGSAQAGSAQAGSSQAGSAGAAGGPACGEGPTEAGAGVEVARDVLLSAGSTSVRLVDVRLDPRSGLWAMVHTDVANGVFRSRLRMISAQGDALAAGPFVAVEDATFPAASNAADPAVAAASGEGPSKMLVVWSDDKQSGGNGQLEIRGQFFGLGDPSAAPVPSGNNFIISNHPETDEWQPAVAYEPGSGNFVALWSDDREKITKGAGDFRTAWARSVGPDGALGDEMKLGDDNLFQVSLNAASGGGMVLAVWVDYVMVDGKINTGARVRLIDAKTSKTVGPIVELARPKVWHTDPPAVAYDERACRFLVAWPENDPFQVYGALVSPSGEIVRPRFPLTNQPDGAGAPRLAWSPATNSYALTFHSWTTSDASVVELNPQGDPVGQPRSLHATPPPLGTFWHPAAPGKDKSFLITTSEDYSRIEGVLLRTP